MISTLSQTTRPSYKSLCIDVLVRAWVSFKCLSLYGVNVHNGKLHLCCSFSLSAGHLNCSDRGRTLRCIGLLLFTGSVWETCAREAWGAKIISTCSRRMRQSSSVAYRCLYTVSGPCSVGRRSGDKLLRGFPPC